MPTPAERHALFFLSSLLILGGAARAFASLTGNGLPPSLQERAALDTQIRAVDSARKTASAKRATRKRRARQPRSATQSAEPGIPAGSAISQSPTFHSRLPLLLRNPRRSRRKQPDSTATNSSPIRVDLDVAPPDDIERLPRIGPVLAHRIIADRDSLGPFGSMKALTRVRGVGPALARILKPYVTFSLEPRPHGVADPRGGGTTRKRRRGRSHVSDPP